MNKKLDNVLFIVGLVAIALVLLFVTDAYSANVTDNNKGTNGYILVNNGTGQGHQGTWTDPTFLKGKDGLNGINGLDGKDGYTPIKNIDYFDGLNGINGVDGLDGLTPIKGVDYFDGTNGVDGLNGVNGKDVDPIEVSRLDNRIDTSNTNINSEATVRSSADTKLQNNINSANSRIDDVSNRVSKLERTQYVVKTELKFIREKHLEVGVYTEYNAGRNVVSEVGLNIVIPIGESYLDRENKKINARLTALEHKVGTAAVIERTVDSKGNVKSISITEGQLRVNGQF